MHQKQPRKHPAMEPYQQLCFNNLNAILLPRNPTNKNTSVLIFIYSNTNAIVKKAIFFEFGALTKWISSKRIMLQEQSENAGHMLSVIYHEFRIIVSILIKVLVMHCPDTSVWHPWFEVLIAFKSIAGSIHMHHA